MQMNFSKIFCGRVCPERRGQQRNESPLRRQQAIYRTAAGLNRLNGWNQNRRKDVRILLSSMLTSLRARLNSEIFSILLFRSQ
jgi:hypothetical protein